MSAAPTTSTATLRVLRSTGPRSDPAVQSSLLDWGFDGTSVWVPTSSGADYCRDVGGTNNVDSYIACTPFDGTSFGATVQSSVVDWRIDGSAVWTGFTSGGPRARSVRPAVAVVLGAAVRRLVLARQAAPAR